MKKNKTKQKQRKKRPAAAKGRGTHITETWQQQTKSRRNW